MTYADQVRSAPNPQEALLAIAAGIDEILAKAPEPAAADPWGQWDRHANAVDDSSWPTKPPPRDTATIATVQQAIADCTDPNELAALEARLRLLTDDGAAIAPVIAEGARATATHDDSTVTVDIPPASPGRQQGRRKFAQDNRLWEFLSNPALTEDEFVDAWAKGGPLWLYEGDRDAIMRMSAEWRRQFIADIESDSPAQAYEVARDILKDLEPQDAGNVRALGH